MENTHQLLGVLWQVAHQRWPMVHGWPAGERVVSPGWPWWRVKRSLVNEMEAASGWRPWGHIPASKAHDRDA